MGMCFFVSDLHGRQGRYLRLFEAIAAEKPDAVFLGGDLLPNPLTEEAVPAAHFVTDFLLHHLSRLRTHLDAAAPRLFIVPGNDDPRTSVAEFEVGEQAGVWEFIHHRQALFGEYTVYGYGCVPPTPFQLKDWEVYDVSRYVDPGCVSPEEGFRTVALPAHEVRHRTIAQDLAELTGDEPMELAIMLFHSPPYQGMLDRAALDGVKIDHVPLDVHVGSIAIQRFIETRQPRVTLHGHIHESARITGSWREQRGRTHCFTAAHEGSALALVRFDPADPAAATRALL
jgi:Icc-related predicted phosphoesterase